MKPVRSHVRSHIRRGGVEAAAEATPYEAWLRLETGQHTDPVRQLQLSPNGKTLVSAGDCTLRLWDAATRQALRVLRGRIGPDVDDTPGHGQVLRFAISRDSDWVVALKSWRTTRPGGRTALATELQVFDMATGNLQAAFTHTGRWVDLDFSPDGRWLLVAACTAPGPRCRATLHTYAWADVLRAGFGHAPAVAGRVAIGACTGDDDCPVAAGFVPVPQANGGDATLVVVTNPPPRRGRPAGRLRWAQLSPTGQLSLQHGVLTEGPVMPATLALSKAHAAVAACSEPGTPGDPPGRVLCHDHRGQTVASLATESRPSALAFGANGRQLIVGLHARRPNFRTVPANVYDTAGGAFRLQSTYYGHDDSITAVALCADGTAVSSGGDNQALHFWSPDHRMGVTVATLRGAGRTLWHAGIDEHDLVGFGVVPPRQLPMGHPKRQQRFDLQAMRLQAAGPGEVDGCDGESAKWRLDTDPPGLSIPLRCRADDGDPAASPDLTLFVGSDDEWVVFSRSGYYNASAKGEQYFGYHVNRGAGREALFLPSDRFRALFYRRDLVRAVVTHGSEARARAAGVDIPAVDVTEVLPPIVELAADRPQVRGGRVTLRFTVESPCADSNPVQRVWVLQNERFAWAAPHVAATGQYQLTRSLRSGPNTFKLFAEGPRSRSLPVTHTVQGPAADNATTSTDTLPGNLYLLCVGVSQFAAAGTPAAGSFKPLLYAHKDAIAVHNALGQSRFSSRIEPRRPFVNRAFKAVHACLLLNEQATKDRIRDELHALCAQIQAREKTHAAERDVLVVFLAGHGVRMKGSPKLYFWNHDLDPQRLDDTGLSMVELGEIATAVPAEVVIAMDACHSGMAGANALAGVNAEELARRIHAVNERGIYVMNAARSEELSRENLSQGHGFFTGALLTALAQEKSLVAENTGGNERSLSMLGLIAAVQELVPYLTKQGQTSVFRVYGDLLPLTIFKR